MPSFSAPIVGMYFHPPAKATVMFFPTGLPLYLLREPTNEHDPNAIKVMVSIEAANTAIDALPLSTNEDFETELQKYGFDLDYLTSEPHFMGYIGRDYAAHLAPLMDDPANSFSSVTLSFDAGGKPQADITFEVAEES